LPLSLKLFLAAVSLVGSLGAKPLRFSDDKSILALAIPSMRSLASRFWGPQRNPLPDYEVMLRDENTQVTFAREGANLKGFLCFRSVRLDAAGNMASDASRTSFRKVTLLEFATAEDEPSVGSWMLRRLELQRRTQAPIIQLDFPLDPDSPSGARFLAAVSGSHYFEWAGEGVLILRGVIFGNAVDLIGPPRPLSPPPCSEAIGGSEDLSDEEH
jgi:hypothetical protein